MHFSKVVPLLLSIPLSFAAPLPGNSEDAHELGKDDHSDKKDHFFHHGTATATTCTTGITPSRSAEVVSAFSSSGVVPTLIPAIDPVVDVRVVYGDKEVDLGNEFSPLETLTAPELTFTAEPDQDPEETTYSYFMVDPDVPSPDGAAGTGIRLNFLHWYVSGAKSICATSQSPETVALYQPPTPGSATEHRYTFLVYREPAGYEPLIISPNLRLGFDVNTYAADGGLELVGGNFFLEGLLS